MAELASAQQSEQAQVPAEDEDFAVPDVELLKFQKERSTPAIRLSEVNVDGTEDVHAEVEDFSQVEPNSPFLGMAKAGTDEQIVLQLKRAGSLGDAVQTAAATE